MQQTEHERDEEASAGRVELVEMSQLTENR